MKVLLVQPPPGTDFGFTNVLRIEPYGLESVGASLLQAGHEVEIVDMRLDDWVGLKSRFEAFGPGFVGVGCQFMSNTYAVIHTGNMLKALDPGVLMCVGGHHATLRPQDILYPESPFDVLVYGEGEVTAAALVDGYERRREVERIPGVMTLSNMESGFVKRGRVPSLDQLPLPARHLTERYRGRYHQGSKVPSACVETSRGCPFDCNFCSIWVFYERTSRHRSAGGILSDLKDVAETNIFFTDDIAFLHRPTYEALGKMLRAEGVRKLYSAETRCDLVVKYRDLFELWGSIGLDSVLLGVEKIDDEGLKAVRKRTDGDTNRLAIRMLQDMGIRPYTAFIVDPDWVEDDFDRLETYIDDLDIGQPTFTILTPLPGTELYGQMRDRLIDHNYLMYDTVHAVLPTRLPLERFYERFAQLYARTARWERVGFSAMRTAIRLTASGHGAVYKRLLKALRQLRDPAAYLAPPFEQRPAGAQPLAPLTDCRRRVLPSLHRWGRGPTNGPHRSGGGLENGRIDTRGGPPSPR